MKKTLTCKLILSALSLSALSALAIGPAPQPLAQKETLSVGFVKVGHLSPMLNMEEELKKFNIEVKKIGRASCRERV